MAPSSGAETGPPSQLTVIDFATVTIDRQIGAGSFAFVYKAKHPQLGLVALKVLMPRFATQPYQLGLFMQEATLLSKIRHSNIIECYGMCQIPAGYSAGGMKAPVATWGMVLEYCEGGTLAQKLMQQLMQPSSRSYSAMDALNWMVDIARALHFLHSQLPIILHRDLKQENILITRDSSGRSVAKLVDFGLHKAVERERSTMLRSRDISQSNSARAGEPLDMIRTASSQLKAAGSGGSGESVKGNSTSQLFFPIPAGGALQKKTRLGPGPSPDPSLYADVSVNGGGSSAASHHAATHTTAGDCSSHTVRHSASGECPTTTATSSSTAAAAAVQPAGQSLYASSSQQPDVGGRSSSGGARAAAATASASGSPAHHHLYHPAAAAVGECSNHTAQRSLTSECPTSAAASAAPSAGSAGDARAAAAYTNGDHPLQVGVVFETMCPDDDTVGQLHAAGQPAGQPEGQEMLDVMEAGGLRPELDWQLVWALTGETGSPMYMAPEVTALLPYNEKVDIFSFGVIMYEVFTWSLLRISHVRSMRTSFQSIDEYAAAVSSGYRPERSGVLSDRLWTVIQNCWTPDPCARSSTSSIISELEDERLAVKMAPPPSMPYCQCTLS